MESRYVKKERNSWTHKGLWATVEMHNGKVDHHRNWPQTPGSTSEYSHTRSTPANDPEIQDSANDIHIAEELSRLQVQGQTGSTTLDSDKVTTRRTRRECDIFTACSDIRLHQIRDVQEEDPVYRQIKMYCLKGWPDKYSLNDAMKPCR